jgi:hypothetical protein
LLLLEARCSKLLSVEGRTLLHISKALLPKAALLIWSAPGLRENHMWCSEDFGLSIMASSTFVIRMRFRSLAIGDRYQHLQYDMFRVPKKLV